jgi:chromosome segregation ATPase
MMGPDKSTTITDAKFSYAYWHGKTGEGKVRYGEDELLLTATEIAENIAGRRCAECYPTYEELKSRNAELEALLKEVMATRDEAIRQNDELIADCANWKEAAQRYHDSAKVADAAADELRKENRELKAAVDKLKDTLVDRTKDVQHYKEENDSLKSQVGKYTADIQDMAAEIHFLKADRDNQKAAYDELKGRYDEFDSVNHEQAEKIRKLDKALADLKERNDKLQAENTNLTFLLEDAPEKETTKTLHVVLNDGTEIEFRRYTAYDYRTDINMFVVKDGEKYIAGFLRGDKSMNLAYWWTE